MSNPVFACLACGQSDDHPKHVVDLDGTHIARMHMDCCASVRGCEICAPVVKAAKGKTGEALRDHIMTKKG
jgi:hypothetical protein